MTKTHKLNKKNNKKYTKKRGGGGAGAGHTIPMAITIKSWKGLSLAQMFFLVQGPSNGSEGEPGNCFIIFNLFKGLMNKATSLARGVSLGVGNVVTSTLTGNSVEQKSATALIIDQLIKKDIGFSSTTGGKYFGGNEEHIGGQQTNPMVMIALLPFAPVIMAANGVVEAGKLGVSGIKRITASDSFTSNTNFTAESIFFVFDIDEKTNTLLYNQGTGYSSPKKYDEKNPNDYFKDLALPKIEERFMKSHPYKLDYAKFYSKNPKAMIKPATKEQEAITLSKQWYIKDKNDIAQFKWKNRITGSESNTIPEEIKTDEIKQEAEKAEAWENIIKPYSEEKTWRNKITGEVVNKIPAVLMTDDMIAAINNSWKLITPPIAKSENIPETIWENTETKEKSNKIPDNMFTDEQKEVSLLPESWVKKYTQPWKDPWSRGGGTFDPFYHTIQFYWENKISGEIVNKIPPILLTDKLKFESETVESWVPQTKKDTTADMMGRDKTEIKIINWINVITGEITTNTPLIVKQTEKIKLKTCGGSVLNRTASSCMVSWFGDTSGKTFQDLLIREMDRIDGKPVKSEDEPVKSKDEPVKSEDEPVKSEDEPVKSEETNNESVIAEPTTAEPATTEETNTETVNTEPVKNEPTTIEPIKSEPINKIIQPVEENNIIPCADRQIIKCEDVNNLDWDETKEECVVRRTRKKCGTNCIKRVPKKCSKKHKDEKKIKRCIEKRTKRCH